MSRISKGDLVELKTAQTKLKKFQSLKDVVGVVVDLYVSEKPTSNGKEIAVVMWMREARPQLKIFSERLKKVKDGRG